MLPDVHRRRVNSTLCVSGHEVQSFWAGPMFVAKGRLDHRSAVEHQSQVTRFVELSGDDLAPNVATQPIGTGVLRERSKSSPSIDPEEVGQEPNNRVVDAEFDVVADERHGVQLLAGRERLEG